MTLQQVQKQALQLSVGDRWQLVQTLLESLKVVTLSPELEALLRDRTDRQGQDVSLMAAQLLANVLQWEAQDSEETIQGIQQGLDDFEAGRSRSF